MWSLNPVWISQDILAVRAFTQAVAKATRWRDSLPDPAEHPCFVMAFERSSGEVPDLFMRFDGDGRFVVSLAKGALAVNGRNLFADTDRYGEIVAAAKKFVSSLSKPTGQKRLPNSALALVNQFVEMWRMLDTSLEPKAVFELHRMFGSTREAAALLKQVRMQHSPYVYKEFNRFQQIDDYFTSRPDRFVSVLSPIAGNKLWTVK
jgi:hypothetical protein